MLENKVIKFKKFGNVLSGREEGKETYKQLNKEIEGLKDNEILIFDLTDVDVLNPSYADETIVSLVQNYPEKIKLEGEISLAVRKSLEALERFWNLKILPRNQ